MATFNSINSNLPGNNTFLGSESGKALTSGIENVGMGFDSLTDVTSGSDNVTLGNITGTEITTGSQNTILGSGSGAFLKTGSLNTLVGYLVGSNYTTSESKNLVIGSGFSGTALDTKKFFLGFIDGIDDVSFAHNVGVGNTFLGENAGNLGLTQNMAQYTVGIGLNTLSVLTDGSSNTAVGSGTLSTLTTGGYNTALGIYALSGVVSGQYNTAVGWSSGVNYTVAESSNIVIGNYGIIGESNVIRLGTTGNLTAQQNKCFIAGTTGVTPDNADAQVMIMDSDGQLGTLGAMTDGQIVIGSTAANPVVASLTAGANITITPGAGTITIAAAGGGGSSFPVTLVSGAVPMSSNNGYRVAFNTTASFTLPATAAVGEIIAIYLENDGNYGTNNPVLNLAQGAGQQIFFGGTPSTAGVGHGFSSTTSFGGAVILRCIVADTVWFVDSNSIQSAGVY